MKLKKVSFIAVTVVALMLCFAGAAMAAAPEGEIISNTVSQGISSSET